jgi:hypothetical protein
MLMSAGQHGVVIDISGECVDGNRIQRHVSLSVGKEKRKRWVGLQSNLPQG